MFALVAAIIWFLAALGVGLGSINMLLFGLAFLGLHFAFGWGLPVPAPWNRQPPG
jgi:hypothetical protein